MKKLIMLLKLHGKECKMAVDNKKVVSWFDNRKGKLTYSMYGSRNGADGTADCSGSITQSIFEAGAEKYAYLYSTVTLASYLQANGYTCISKNQDWDAQGGEIVLMSWGADMSSSGGAGGHVGVMKDTNTFISVDYWTGGQAGTAVSEHNWNQYYAANKPSYVEVWRNIMESSKPTPVPPASASSAIDTFKNKYQGRFTIAKIKVDVIKNVNGGMQFGNYDLANGGKGKDKSFNWTNNGIPFALVNLPEDANVKVGDILTVDMSGTIDQYDTASNGVGVNFTQPFNAGMIWFNADALLNRF